MASKSKGGEDKRKKGLPPQKKRLRRPIEGSIHKKAYEMYRSGMSMQSIADITLVSLGMVETWSRDFEWSARSRRPIDKAIKISAELEAATDLYRQSMNIFITLCLQAMKGKQSLPKNIPLFMSFSFRDVVEATKANIELQKWLQEPAQREVLEREFEFDGDESAKAEELGSILDKIDQYEKVRNARTARRKINKKRD